MKGFFTFIFLCIVCIIVSCEHTERRNKPITKPRDIVKEERVVQANNTNESSIVHMKKSGGVYIIPVKLNGIELHTIFDTGASDVVISKLEALLLMKQGTISEEDILGEEYYKVADGSICVGTIINLRTVQIGNRVVRNVKATVVDNIEAELLLGQSALARFGQISINYDSGTITFK